MLRATRGEGVWGTLLVDRKAMPLRRKHHEAGSASPYSSRVTLVGDAAHCMTPFKGQGANQSLADAPLLAKHVAPALHAEHAAAAAAAGGGGGRHVRGGGVAAALSRFEREMGDRAEAKVVASRQAAGLYHSAAALDPGAYGIEGVPGGWLDDVRALMAARGVTAARGGALEAEAIAAVEAIAARRQHEEEEEEEEEEAVGGEVR